MMSRRPLQQLEVVRAHVPLRPFQKEPLPPISDDIFTGESMLSKFKLFIDQHTEKGTVSGTMQIYDYLDCGGAVEEFPYEGSALHRLLSRGEIRCLHLWGCVENATWLFRPSDPSIPLDLWPVVHVDNETYFGLYAQCLADAIMNLRDELLEEVARPRPDVDAKAQEAFASALQSSFGEYSRKGHDAATAEVTRFQEYFQSWLPLESIWYTARALSIRGGREWFHLGCLQDKPVSSEEAALANAVFVATDTIEGRLCLGSQGIAEVTLTLDTLPRFGVWAWSNGVVCLEVFIDDVEPRASSQALYRVCPDGLEAAEVRGAFQFWPRKWEKDDAHLTKSAARP